MPMGMHILSKKLVIYTSFKKIAFNETLDAEGEDMQPMGAHILSKKLLAPRLRVKWVNLGRFWGKQKKNKKSADEYLSFQIQEFESTTLETTLGAFCERSFSLLDATNAAM